MHPADIFSIHVCVATSSGGAFDALAAVVKEALNSSSIHQSVMGATCRKGLMYLFMTEHTFIHTVACRDQQQQRRVTRRCSGQLASLFFFFPFYTEFHADGICNRHARRVVKSSHPEEAAAQLEAGVLPDWMAAQCKVPLREN